MIFLTQTGARYVLLRVGLLVAEYPSGRSVTHKLSYGEDIVATILAMQKAAFIAAECDLKLTPPERMTPCFAR